MNREKMKQVIEECCNDLVFEINGKRAGVTSEVEDSIPTFFAWYVETTKEYKDVESVMNDKFYGGKSLFDLIGTADFYFL